MDLVREIVPILRTIDDHIDLFEATQVLLKGNTNL